jgi:hypothetical protein
MTMAIQRAGISGICPKMAHMERGESSGESTDREAEKLAGVGKRE